jgi:7-carboxy-7-deazaguanine synthase
MTALRLIEHYVSTQGEGPRVGTLTQFVRFAGCNLKCAKWPCDSEFAINPKLYRDEQKSMYHHEVAQKARDLRTLTGALNICLTGGEPFLQPNEELLRLLKQLNIQGGGAYTFEAFTNGTFEVSEAFFEAGLRLVMDWKLPGSGEQTWINQRTRNLTRMAYGGGHAVKFTIADEADFDVALQVWDAVVMDSAVEVFVGPVWDDKWGATDVVDLIKKYKVPWRLNVQIHNYIYGAQVRGT